MEIQASLGSAPQRWRFRPALSPAQAEYGWHLDKVDYFDDDGDWVRILVRRRRPYADLRDRGRQTIGYIADGLTTRNPEEGSGSKSDWDNLTDIPKKRRRSRAHNQPRWHALATSCCGGNAHRSLS